MAHKRLFAAAALSAAAALGSAALLATGRMPAAHAADPSQAAVGASGATADAGPRLKLTKGAHVCIVGNTLADRMQHSGWVETWIHANFPDQELSFWNLGFSGDEVNMRLRSEGFGSQDQWLTGTKADIVFAFFGYNESYRGEAGLGKFKDDLDKALKGMLRQQYNGKSNPQVVLFSPIAFENLKSPNFPDGVEQNKNLKLYTAAMADTAKANNVVFVDLFAPTLEMYAGRTTPMTINGVHLTDEGYERLAPTIFRALFPDAPMKKIGGDTIEKIRKAVADKNFYWFERYRTLDGYNTFGGRSKQVYNGIYNFDVMQRELQVLDVMASNRDKAIWAAAQGKDYKVDDTNTPPFIPVTTNKPGKGPNGTHIYLSGEEEIQHLKLSPGLKINLFADEKKFPELVKPVQMSFDTKGRLWVACWPSYPHWRPKDEMNDKLIILEDTDGDGVADKKTVFADHLNCPTGFEFYNGGVLLAQAPNLWFLKDTNGDDVADTIERVVGGLDSADSHHTSNSFVFDPGGALYFQEGTFHHSQVETPWGPPERTANGASFRYEPRTGKFEVYTAYGFANPHGHVFDAWGTDIVTDGTGAQPYYGPTFSGKTYFPDKHPGTSGDSKTKIPVVYRQRTRPCSGTEILSSKHFPEEFQGNFLVCNVIFPTQGILRYKLEEKGAGLVGTEIEPLVQSDDPNFRPSAVQVGPDGAIYFCDWQNAIIGHLQHHIRDPSRDHTHGRVYRITYEGRPPTKPAKIAGEPVDKLLDLLKDADNRVRYRAKIELSGRPTADVIPAVEKWVKGLDEKDPAYPHQLTEGLWVYQWNNVVNEPLLKQALKSPDYHARAAAARVLCYQRDRVPEALALFKALAGDESPRVRLEAVRACSFFRTPDAQEVALESLNKPQDEYLKYVLDETMKTLDRVGKGLDVPAAKPKADKPKADKPKKDAAKDAGKGK